VITKAGNDKIRRLIQSVGVKGELAKTAKRLLRETAEADAARAEGRVKAWLDDEANSFAESAYAILLERVEEFGGRS